MLSDRLFPIVAAVLDNVRAAFNLADTDVNFARDRTQGVATPESLKDCDPFRKGSELLRGEDIREEGVEGLLVPGLEDEVTEMPHTPIHNPPWHPLDRTFHVPYCTGT